MGDKEDYTYEFNNFHEENNWRLRNQGDTAIINVEFDYSETWGTVSMKIAIEFRENKSSGLIPIDPTRNSEYITFFTIKPLSEKPANTDKNYNTNTVTFQLASIISLFIFSKRRKNINKKNGDNNDIK